MESRCHYITYLRKLGNKWQIYSDNIITEETAIKYGKAAEIEMDISSPLIAKEGEEYCISLNIKNKPQGALMLASLSREEIKYPPSTPVDKFRKSIHCRIVIQFGNLTDQQAEGRITKFPLIILMTAQLAGQHT